MSSTESYNFFEEIVYKDLNDLRPGEKVLLQTDNNNYTLTAKDGSFYISNSELPGDEFKKIKMFGIPAAIKNEPERMIPNSVSVGDNLEIYFENDESAVSIGPVKSIKFFQNKQ